MITTQPSAEVIERVARELTEFATGVYADPASDDLTVELACELAKVKDREAAMRIALRRLINSIDDDEGRLIVPIYSTCLICTKGVVPNDRNRGRCPYHAAVKLLFDAGEAIAP